MWLSFLCVFPPLISDEPLSLERAGTSMAKAFTVPVNKKYAFDLRFEFPSVKARIQDQIVGSRFDENCRSDIKYQEIPEPKRVDLGRPISFRIVIRRKSDSAILIDRAFNSLCITSHVDNKKWRTIGWVELTRGEYTTEITNLEAQVGLASVKTYISLVAGHGK